MELSNSELLAKVQSDDVARRAKADAARARDQDLRNRIRRVLDAALPVRIACHARPLDEARIVSSLKTLGVAIIENGWNEKNSKSGEADEKLPIEWIEDTRLHLPLIAAAEFARRTIAAAIRGDEREVQELVSSGRSIEKSDRYFDCLGHRTLTAMMETMVPEIIWEAGWDELLAWSDPDARPAEQPMAAANDAPAPIAPSTLAARKGRNATANELMLSEIQKNPHEVRGFTAEQWSKRIRRSKSVIFETKTWKELAISREQLRLERRTDRGKNRTGRKRKSD